MWSKRRLRRMYPGLRNKAGKTSRTSSPQPPTSVFSRQPTGNSARDLLIAVVAVTGIAAHLLLRFGFGSRVLLQNIPLYVVLLLAVFRLFIRLIQKSLAREFGSDLLAGISIVASPLMGQFLVGSIVVLMLSGGTALEEFATRARFVGIGSALQADARDSASQDGSRNHRTSKPRKLRWETCSSCFPMKFVPVDGIVVEGQGRMNEAYLTGEPFETSKTEGAEVISGAINGESALAVRATKLPIDSRYARIMRVMVETQARRPKLRRLGDMLGAWYTPLAVAIALGLMDRERRISPISCRCCDRDALPAPAGDSRCDHRGDFALGEAQHHYQESGRAGTSGAVHDADL